MFVCLSVCLLGTRWVVQKWLNQWTCRFGVERTCIDGIKYHWLPWMLTKHWCSFLLNYCGHFMSSCGTRRFLADIMDNPNLIRNVALVGHLHHGKVTDDVICAWMCVRAWVCICLQLVNCFPVLEVGAKTVSQSPIIRHMNIFSYPKRTKLYNFDEIFLGGYTARPCGWRGATSSHTLPIPAYRPTFWCAVF